MSFSSTAKEELMRLPLGKSCCILSELSALTQTSGSLAFRGAGRIQVTYRVENAALARRIFLLLRTQLRTQLIREWLPSRSSRRKRKRLQILKRITPK